MTTTAHPFEHLGPAPYRFVGVFTMPSKGLLDANPEAYNSALAGAPRMESGLGTCSHCSTAISNVFVVECGDKTRWGVGCDCILKINGEHLNRAETKRLLSDVEAAKRKMLREQRHANEAAKLEEADNWIREHKDVLDAIPHPQKWAADKGQTMLDSLAWYWDHAGTSGKLKAYKAARKAAESV